MPTAVVKRVTKRTVPPHDYNLRPTKRRTTWKTNFMNTPADRGPGRGGPLDRAFHKLNQNVWDHAIPFKPGRKTAQRYIWKLKGRVWRNMNKRYY